MEEIKVNREYKDRVFKLLFSDRKNLLSLYNAVNGTDITDEAVIEVNTLENAIYMKMQNDISFLIDTTLNLYEHQSTVNPNMPIRGLFYFTEILQKILKDENLYGPKAIEIPTPQYVVFYNGDKDIGETEVLKLSDCFKNKAVKANIEVEATMININYGENKSLMEKCLILQEYASMVNKVKKNMEKGMKVSEAIDRAVEKCIEEGILREFLRNHRAEVSNMLLYEYDEERNKRDWEEYGMEKGMERGMKALICTLYEIGVPKATACDKLMEKYSVVRSQAEKIVNELYNA